MWMRKNGLPETVDRKNFVLQICANKIDVYVARCVCVLSSVVVVKLVFIWLFNLVPGFLHLL